MNLIKLSSQWLVIYVELTSTSADLVENHFTITISPKVISSTSKKRALEEKEKEKKNPPPHSIHHLFFPPSIFFKQTFKLHTASHVKNSNPNKSQVKQTPGSKRERGGNPLLLHHCDYSAGCSVMNTKACLQLPACRH